MTDNGNLLIGYLRPFVKSNPALVDSFHNCSYDITNDRFLVESNVHTINFDKLTQSIRGRPLIQSADALSLTDDYVYLIEFKSGDQTNHENKLKRLIDGVSGKINQSEETLDSFVFPKVYNNPTDYFPLRFFLVVDSVEMGIDTSISILAELSLTETTPENIKALFNSVLPDLKSGIKNPERFDTVDVWYSELFDKFLALHNIVDISV